MFHSRLEGLLDPPRLPLSESYHVFQISAVLKRAIFSSRTENIPYEAWDSIEWITADSIEWLYMKVERREYLEVSSDDPYVTLRY